MSDSVRPHRWQPTRPRSPWDSLGKNTGVGCHFLLQCMKVKSESEVAQSCPTLSDPMDCSLPDFSVHGIFQARVLEWGAIAFSQFLLVVSEIKRRLLLGRKAMTNLDSILKSRGITLLTKVHLVKAMVFPVVTYGCESWTIKKAEGWRIDAFELWEVFESPLDCKEIQPVHPKGDQSWVFIEKTDVEAETPILWPPDVENRLTGKFPDAGKEWSRGSRRGGQRMRRLDDITDAMDMSLVRLLELVMDREACLQACCSQTQLSDWTEVNWRLPSSFILFFFF